MSPVIALDIAVVAQKVKVQCYYIMADMLNLKKWGGGCITNRSVWLLELVTELTSVKNKNNENRNHKQLHSNVC